MKKKVIIISLVCFIVISGLVFFIRKEKSITKKVNERKDNIHDYHLEANMEMVIGDEVKTYKVDVDYLNQDGEYFKVSIFDKLLNQSQVIMRNLEGVYVYTPSINQVYKFKSEWPYNSDKPYIYQTLLKYFDQEYELKKENNQVLLKGNVTHPHDQSIVRQEICLSKDLIPQYVSVLDEQGTEKIHVEFTKFEYNQGVDQKIFEVTPYDQTQTSSFDDYPLFPLEVFGSKLTSQEQTSVNGNTKHILQFSGDKNFTIIETINDKEKEQEIIATSGELIDLVGGFGVYENDELKMLYPGMTCSVYSKDMTKFELIEVGNSLRVEVLK